MLRKTILTLAAVLCFTSAAYAGGGPPETYNDLAYAAQYIEEQIAYYESTGSLDYDITTPCVKWSNFVSWIEYYNMYETKFHSAAVRSETTFTWAIKLAQATGQNQNLIPTYKLNRLKAQQKIAKMDAWHAKFSTFYYGTAYGLRATYCAEEQLCVADPEPQYSTVTVTRFPTPPVVHSGYGQTFFGFNLAMVSGDSQLDEDGQFDQVVVAMFITGDQYDRVHNCSLVSGGFTMSYTGGPDFTLGDKYGVLVFNVQPNTVIPKGTAAAFSVTCDILVPFEPDTVIQTGFFVDKGTPPIDAIVVHGANTAEKLQVTPNEDIYSTVVFY